MRISEAYSVLSHAEKRARYDRDVMRHRHNNPPKHPPHSYYSSGPAGGRPASGLSRRRGTFTGPPPSFFRSGGWGSYSAKRKAAHEETTGTGGDMGGMGPGADPLHRPGRTPGFDSERHEAQHRRVQEHVARSRGPGISPLVDTGLMLRFMVVAGIICAVAYIPYWVIGAGEQVKKKKKTA
jgi:curved DNA-binding protein CbpA